jgi:hypothetical protein
MSFIVIRPEKTVQHVLPLANALFQFSLHLWYNAFVLHTVHMTIIYVL